MISPGLRKPLLTTHIATSVGWLGAVVAYLALDIVATGGRDPAIVRAAFFGMEVIIVYVIVPLAFASVLIAIVNSVSAPWGLFQHYWVVVKLALTLFRNCNSPGGSGRSEIHGRGRGIRRRSARLARLAAALHRRPGCVARYDDIVGVQAARRDSLWVA